MDMTIDEAIEHAIEVSEIQRNNDKLNKTLGVISPYYKTDCIKCAEEHEQLAEWLEELKEYKENQHRSLRHMYEKGYNKALDDFVKFASDMPTVEEEDGEIRPMWLEEMAEQLKAGGNIELSEYSKSQGNRTGK